MLKQHIQGAAISAGIALLTGYLSGYLSGGQKELYQTLNQPPFAPPAWLFGVVWTVLYILMGIAAYLIYISAESSPERTKALILYALQLFVNFSWSIVFFRFQSYGAAVLVLALLLILVALTMMLFYKINRCAAFLLIPYFLWLLIAYYLNIGVFVLN